jgi:transmembrane sensor
LTQSETKARIDEEAARWAARHVLADWTDAEEAEFQAWLAADRRHQGAYLRAEASYHALEDAVLASPAPVPSNDDEPIAAPAAGWWTKRARPALAAGLAIAACVTAVALIRTPGSTVLEMHGAHERLADGSSVVFGKGGAISASIDGKTRRITLDRGSATFHVAKDRSRPFIVRSGQVYAEATGTVYSVRRVGSAGGAVRVSEGSVKVWEQGARDKAVMLHAGQALTLDPVTARTQAENDFWFDNVSIAEASARFNKVNTTQIAIADQAIGRVTIMGGFKPDRPAEFARAAAAITGARVTEREGTLVIGK